MLILNRGGAFRGRVPSRRVVLPAVFQERNPCSIPRTSERTVKATLCAAVVAVAVCSSAQASATLTKDQAFKKARTCLLKQHPASVVRRGDGGGFAYFRGQGSTFWSYKTLLRQVSSVKVSYAGQPGLTGGMKKKVEACLTAGI